MSTKLTRNSQEEIVKGLNLKKEYSTFCEPESITLCFKTRKPWKIVDGRLVGSEIGLYDQKIFRVWTSKVKLARKLSKQYSLKLDLMTGECELYIPANLADNLLPKFGVKVKRKVTEKMLFNLEKARRSKI